MSKALAVPEKEQIGLLAEEIKSLVTLTRDEVTERMIAMKYQIGQLIVEHPLYRKFTKANSAIFAEVAGQAGVREQGLRDCVKFYETYPDEKPQKIAERLFQEHGSWRETRKALYGGDSNVFESSEGQRPACKHCPLHCKN